LKEKIGNAFFAAMPLLPGDFRIKAADSRLLATLKPVLYIVITAQS